VTTEVLGLQIALARNPVELTLDLRRLSGHVMTVGLLFPDEVSALALKPSQPRSESSPPTSLTSGAASRSASPQRPTLQRSVAEPQATPRRSSGNSLPTTHPACRHSPISSA